MAIIVKPCQPLTNSQGILHTLLFTQTYAHDRDDKKQQNKPIVTSDTSIVVSLSLRCVTM